MTNDSLNALAELANPQGAEAVLALDVSEVSRVYSGKPGCGCGCRGTYWDDQRNVTRVVNLMKQRAAEVEQEGGRVGVQPSTGGLAAVQGSSGGVAYVESDNRYLWAYLR